MVGRVVGHWWQLWMRWLFSNDTSENCSGLTSNIGSSNTISAGTYRHFTSVLWSVLLPSCSISRHVLILILVVYHHLGCYRWDIGNTLLSMAQCVLPTHVQLSPTTTPKPWQHVNISINIHTNTYTSMKGVCKTIQHIFPLLEFKRGFTCFKISMLATAWMCVCDCFVWFWVGGAGPERIVWILRFLVG